MNEMGRLTLALLLLAGAWALSGCAATASDTCEIGKTAQTNGDGYGGLTKAAYDDATSALAAHDRYGYEQVVATGNLVQLDTGMKVRVIDEAWDHVVVRVLESPEDPSLANAEVRTDCSWLSAGS